MRSCGYLFSTVCLLMPTVAQAGNVDFDRDVRPILASRCYQCHGPDDHVRKAGLRLDTQAGAVRKLRSGERAVVAGKPAESALYQRITAKDQSERMPPAKRGKPLSTSQIATLRAWIEQGGRFAPHWAYVPPKRPVPPSVKQNELARNPLDAFVLSRLGQEGLPASPPADRYSLIRRVSLDLVGLPPTPAEVDAFIHDPHPDAYERLVDRLLASPAYGERWARLWLDLARYADSQGYANDPDRTIWRWRDWLIQALNRDQPYDRFTIDMLAGDLLPHQSHSDLLATGFHRNTLTNTEGGTNPEEFRTVAIVDRVNTTFEVWLGTTIGCAQCHNHKYDPFTQKEYYELFALFNNCEDANTGDDAPTLRAPMVGATAEFERTTANLNRVRTAREILARQLDAVQRLWELSATRNSLPKEIGGILALPSSKWNAEQKQKLTAFYRAQSPLWRSVDARFQLLTTRLERISTTSPILREGTPRATHILIRGNFTMPGDLVRPGLPAVFPPPTRKPIDRLTLARWLVDGRNPLTARVAVNRLWEELFGIGLVETSEEFGTQGERPSHSLLLDWLATEYVRSGWDTKRMLRLIVTSATYRQTARERENQLERDPYNRLLARGPRVRLSGEAIRDQALFVSGLFSSKMYGPPVQPPQPVSGLSAAFGGTTDWQTSQGQDRHRRGLYTRWRRNAPYPSLTTFDAPERTVCTIRRVRTNTPLQALVTLNDPVYVEAAQALGRRMAGQPGAIIDRVSDGFRLVLARPPSSAEAQRLVALYEQAVARYRKDTGGALAMATRPLGPLANGADVADRAAWTVVANVLLNLDETLDKR